MKSAFLFLGFLFLTGCCVFRFYYLWSDILKPELEVEPIHYSEEEINKTEMSRDISFTEDDLFKIQQDVDYSERESGSWFLRSEPLVLKGVDSIGKYGGTYPEVFGQV